MTLDRARKLEQEDERSRRPATGEPAPDGGELHPLLALQTVAGNAAVARLVAGRGAAGRRIARVTDAAVLERTNQLRAANGMPPLAALENPPGAEQDAARTELTQIELQGGDQAAVAKAHHKARVDAAFAAEVAARAVSPAWSVDTLRTLADYGAELQPFTGGDGTAFATLASFIGGNVGGANAHARRAQILIAYNNRFGTTDVRLPQGVQAQQWPAFEAIVTALSGPPLDGLHHITTLRISEIMAKVTGLAGADLAKGLDVLDGAVSCGNQGLVYPQRLARMIELYDAFPPGVTFAGSPAWGAGDHPDVATNKYQHFIKHVIHGFDPDQGTEREALWNGLMLRLREQDVVANLPGGAPATAAADIRAAFGHDGGNPVTELTVTNKSALKRLSDLVGNVPEVGTALYRVLGATYLDYIVDLSQNLQDTALYFAGADHQFISGYDGNTYIHCRIYGTDARISSGYWVPNPAQKFAAQREQRLWLL